MDRKDRRAIDKMLSESRATSSWILSASRLIQELTIQRDNAEAQRDTLAAQLGLSPAVGRLEVPTRPGDVFRAATMYNPDQTETIEIFTDGLGGLSYYATAVMDPIDPLSIIASTVQMLWSDAKPEAQL